MIAGQPDLTLTLPTGTPPDPKAPRAKSADIGGNPGLLPSDFAEVLEFTFTIEPKGAAPTSFLPEDLPTEPGLAPAGKRLPTDGKSAPQEEPVPATPVNAGEPLDGDGLAMISPASSDRIPTDEVLAQRSAPIAAQSARDDLHAGLTERSASDRPAIAIRSSQSPPLEAERVSSNEPGLERRIEPATQTEPPLRQEGVSIRKQVGGSQTTPVLSPFEDGEPDPALVGSRRAGMDELEPGVRRGLTKPSLEPERAPGTTLPAVAAEPKAAPRTLVADAVSKSSSNSEPAAAKQVRTRSEPLFAGIAKADGPVAQSPLQQAPLPASAETTTAALQATQPLATGAPAGQAPPAVTQTLAEFRADPRIAPQIEQAIEQLAEARDTVRTARPEILMRHGEFGLVSMRLDASGGDLRATLAARDPGFVPAIQAALADRTVAASQESANTAGQRGQEQGAGTGNSAGNGPQSDARYGSSPGSSQGSHQPQSGHQRTAASEPDARERSGAGSTNSNGDSAGGVFA